MIRWLLAVALAGAMLTPSLAQAQLPPLFSPSGNPVTTGVITTTAAAGSSPIIPLSGHSNCTVVASDTVAGTNVTVNGTAMVSPTVGSQWFPNPNFGTAGVISVGTSPVSTTGNIANFPGGFFFSWTGNAGVLNVYATCSTAVAKRGAPAPTPTPTAGPTPTPTPIPGLTQPIFASTGNVSVTTGAINAFVQLGATQTVTTGISGGPQNKWLVTTTIQAGVNGLTAQPSFLCGSTPTFTFTVLDFMGYNSGNVCAPSTTGTVGNNFMGGPGFANAAGSGNSQNGSSQLLVAHLTVPNSSTFSMNCYAGSTLATGFSLSGYCCIEAIPI